MTPAPHRAYDPFESIDVATTEDLLRVFPSGTGQRFFGDLSWAQANRPTDEVRPPKSAFTFDPFDLPDQSSASSQDAAIPVPTERTIP